MEAAVVPGSPPAKHEHHSAAETTRIEIASTNEKATDGSRRPWLVIVRREWLYFEKSEAIGP